MILKMTREKLNAFQMSLKISILFETMLKMLKTIQMYKKCIFGIFNVFSLFLDFSMFFSLFLDFSKNLSKHRLKIG